MLSECIQGGFLWSEKAFDSVNVTKNYSDVYSIIGNHDDFYEIIDEFESYYGKFLNVYDFSKERENYEKFFYSLREISLVISIVVFFNSILRYNSIFTDCSKARYIWVSTGYWSYKLSVDKNYFH